MDIQAYIQCGIIESYILGLASQQESDELDVLRTLHSEIDLAINDFSEDLEQQAFANAIAPPADMKQKIMSALKNEANQRNIPIPIFIPSVPVEIQTAKIRNISNQWKNIAAAAVLLFLISTVVNFFLYNKYDKKNSDYQALLSEKKGLLADNNVIQSQLKEWKSAAEMMEDPSMMMVKMNAVPGKEQNKALVFWDTKNKDVYVMINKLPPPAVGKQYQLWALMDGKPIDAGVISDCTTTCKMKNIPNAQAFAITLENAGGSPTPTLEAMYVFGKV